MHVCASALALARALPDETMLRGPLEAVLAPPTRSGGGGRTAIGPADLRLSEGRVPHDFRGATRNGVGGEVDHFETLRPDAVLSTSSRPPRDLMLELDDRLASGGLAAKIVRYDHFLTGWAEHTRRYGERRDAEPIVVFVCRSRARARSCAEAADTLLRACRAYAGEYPIDWQYTGRQRTVFVCERDLHEGSLLGYGVSRLPPEVRLTDAHGDPRAARAALELRSLVR